MIEYRVGSQKGFTYIELIIVIGIFIILASIAIVNLNPDNQFAQARNTQRASHINTIILAVTQRNADHQGVFEENCSAGAIPASATKMANGAGNYDIASCLVPIYLPSMSFDPSAADAHYTNSTDYDTGYFIQKAASAGRVTITAPSAELGQVISVTQ